MSNLLWTHLSKNTVKYCFLTVVMSSNNRNQWRFLNHSIRNLSAFFRISVGRNVKCSHYGHPFLYCSATQLNLLIWMFILKSLNCYTAVSHFSGPQGGICTNKIPTPYEDPEIASRCASHWATTAGLFWTRKTALWLIPTLKLFIKLWCFVTLGT